MRLIHVKTICEHHFVALEDGADTGTAISTQAVAVNAGDWPSYPATEFAEARARLAEQIKDGIPQDSVAPDREHPPVHVNHPPITEAQSDALRAAAAEATRLEILRQRENSA